MADYRVNDYGDIFELTVKDSGGSVLDLSGATTQELRFRCSNVSLEKTSSFTTDGTDGKVRYTTATGDLSRAGSWEIWAYWVTSSTGKESTTAQFTVEEN